MINVRDIVSHTKKDSRRQPAALVPMAKIINGDKRGRPGRWLVDYRDGAAAS